MKSENKIHEARTLIRNILIENEDADNYEWYIELKEIYTKLGKIVEQM